MSTFSMYKNEEEMQEMVTHKETKRAKNLKIVPEGRYGMFKVLWDDQRGELPLALSGLFTSKQTAEKAVDKYIANQKPNYEYRNKEDAKRKEELEKKKKAQSE